LPSNAEFSGEILFNEQVLIITKAQFYPKQVRADETGYFIVFESSVQGDSQAALCFERFQGRKFRDVPMKMEFIQRARQMF
jgi:hypothetical protein